MNRKSLLDSELLERLQKTLNLLVRIGNFLTCLDSRVIHHFLHVFEYIAKNVYGFVELFSPRLHLDPRSIVKLPPLILHYQIFDIYRILLCQGSWRVHIGLARLESLRTLLLHVCRVICVFYEFFLDVDELFDVFGFIAISGCSIRSN
jgi:hypothetical protein